jgi:hypothetical protein
MPAGVISMSTRPVAFGFFPAQQWRTVIDRILPAGMRVSEV